MKKILFLAVFSLLTSCKQEKTETIQFDKGKPVVITGNGTIGFRDQEQAQKHFDLVMKGNEDEAVKIRMKSNPILVADNAHGTLIEESEDMSRVILSSDTVWVAKLLVK